MNKVLQYLLCAVLVLGCYTLQAQITHKGQGRLDENATEVLQKATKKLKNVSFSVTYTILDSEKKQQGVYHAEVQYASPKYRLVMQEQEVVSDGVTVWQWNKGAREIVVNNLPPDSEVDLMNPQRLLANYTKNFKAKYIRTEDNGNAVIDMQPRSSQSYHKIRLFINEESGQLNRMEVHKYDSSREIFEFSKQKYGRVGAIKFNPADHPEAEVVDMR